MTRGHYPDARPGMSDRSDFEQLCIWLHKELCRETLTLNSSRHRLLAEVDQMKTCSIDEAERVQTLQEGHAQHGRADRA